MVSEKERREVARKLREVNPYRNQSYTIPYHRYTPAAEYLSELAGALGYSPKNDVSRLEFQNRLADLIEPPRQCPYYDSGRHWCSIHDVPAIDREALLALADEFDAGAKTALAHEWSDQALAIMGHALAEEYAANARRIREALGVDDD